MDKYNKLQQDLTVAVNEAKKKAKTTDDGGTCNFDCCLLFLPRYNEEKTVEAIKAIRFFAQGNQRTVQAEKIAEVMKSKGYDAGLYYQMD